MCASSIKSDIHPKMYTATGKFHDSNRQIYYSNKNLEFQRKQDEINKQLANDYVKLHNGINRMIHEQQILKDKVGSNNIVQNKINQDLLKQISEHETVHAQLSNQLNEQQDISEGLIKQIDKNKVELHNEINEMIHEQQGLKDKWILIMSCKVRLIKIY